MNRLEKTGIRVHKFVTKTAGWRFLLVVIFMCSPQLITSTFTWKC